MESPIYAVRYDRLLLFIHLVPASGPIYVTDKSIYLKGIWRTSYSYSDSIRAYYGEPPIDLRGSIDTDTTTPFSYPNVILLGNSFLDATNRPTNIQYAEAMGLIVDAEFLQQGSQIVTNCYFVGPSGDNLSPKYEPVQHSSNGDVKSSGSQALPLSMSLAVNLHLTWRVISGNRVPRPLPGTL